MATAAGAVVDPDALLALRFLAAEAGRRRGARTSVRPGPFVTRRRGRGSETDDIRLWTHGDDIRHIDRNVTARTGEPHVRTFRDERERTTLLVADFRPPMLFGTRRALLSVAAAEILALVAGPPPPRGAVSTARDRRRGADLGEALRGERAMVAVVGGLADAHRAAVARSSHTPTAMGPTLSAAARAVTAGARMVIASSFEAAGDDLAGHLTEARVRVDLAAAVVSDAFERAAPAGVYPFATLDGRRGIGAVGRREADGGRESRSAAMVEHLRSLGVAAVPMPAEREPAAQGDVLEALHG